MCIASPCDSHLPQRLLPVAVIIHATVPFRQKLGGGQLSAQGVLADVLRALWHGAIDVRIPRLL